MSRRRQAALGLCVLGAHAGLYLGLAALLHKPAVTLPDARPPLVAWLRITPRITPPSQPAPTTPRRPSPARPPDARPRAVGPTLDALRNAGAATDPPATPAQAGQTLAPASRAAAPSPPPAASQLPLPPLNLALPRHAGEPRSAAALAAQDERLNPRLSRDERLAQALGTDTRLLEVQRGSVRRFQQGRACVDVEPAREAALNPFNQSVSATPRQARPC